jgi:hypothetical protein
MTEESKASVPSTIGGLPMAMAAVQNTTTPVPTAKAMKMAKEDVEEVAVEKATGTDKRNRMSMPTSPLPVIHLRMMKPAPLG